MIDTNTDAVLGTVPVGANPTQVAISSDGLLAYVSNTDSSSISVIDTANDVVVNTIPVGASPGAIAVAPNGATLYVSVTTGVQAVSTATGAIANVSGLNFSQSGLAITPDGSRVYAAGGASLVGATRVSVIDTATNSVTASFIPEVAPQPDVVNSPVSVAVSPDGARVYVGVSTYYFIGNNFDAGGGVAVVNTSDNTVTNFIDLFGLPGAIAFTRDGIKAYVAMTARFVMIEGVGAYLNERRVAVIDTASQTSGASIDLGADGAAWFQQNTPSGVAVTPDRGDVYIAIPRINSVALADSCTRTVRLSLPVSARPGGIAIIPDPNAVIMPCPINVVDAVNDSATANHGQMANIDVLANDTLNGAPANFGNVYWSVVSSPSALTLKAIDSKLRVSVALGTAPGPYSLVYRICEAAEPANCDSATVTVNVVTYVIDAVNDAGSISRVGGTAIANVLANDRFNGTVATPAKVTLALLSSSNPGVTLNPANGAVSVAAGTAIGTYSLNYRICETASPANCDAAVATVNVTAYVIDAVNDTAKGSSLGANTPLASVLANDKFGGVRATTSTVTLSQISLTPANSQIRLDLTDGSVDVLGPTTSGLYSLVYRICEIASPANCDQATVALNLSGSTGGGGGGGGGGSTFKINISLNGKGTVTTNPTGTSFASGTVVTLTATPNAGEPWIGWSGACTGTSTTCTLTMTSDKSVTANFR